MLIKVEEYMNNDSTQTTKMQMYIKMFEVDGNWNIKRRALCGTLHDRCMEPAWRDRIHTGGQQKTKFNRQGFKEFIEL